jgi:hypothetical protein
MPGKRPLKRGAYRLLGHHGGVEGKAFRRFYDALEAAYGPFSTALVRFEASRTAVAAVQVERTTRELVAAQRKRRIGRGRKPNERQVERLARRQGLADGSYAAAVKRLEELTRATQHAGDPLAVLLNGER